MARLPTPSTPVRWILTAGTLAVLLVVGGKYYLDLKEEQTELLAGIAQAQQTLDTFRETDTAQYEREIGDLESRLKSAEVRRLNVERQLHEHTHSIEIDEILYQAARESTVTLVHVTCSNPEPQEIGGVGFEVYQVNIKGEADVPPQLINFVQKISATFPDATVDWLEMTFPTRDEEGALQGASAVALQMRVYYTTEQVS